MIEKKWNDGWRFWDDKNAFSMTWDVPRDAEIVELPHDAMLLKPPGPDSPGGRDAAFRFGGSFVYCKTLFAPEDWKDRSAVLRFEGVYHDAAVYVNRQLAARCANGYSVFHVPLDSFLRYGEDNEIRVLVRTADMPNSRWYSGSGIYRDVYLLLGGLLHIGGFGPRASVSELCGGAVISVETPVMNRGSISVRYELETEIMDAGGCCRARERTRLFLAGGDSETVSQRIILLSPRLWSENDPALYTVRATLYAGDGISDRAESRFGVRTLALDAKHGFRVNGEPVKLRGACIHHDSGVLGAATYADAEYRRIKRLKAAGFNAIRSAHNPASPALLRACDELGVYVMDEAFDMWTRAKSDFDYSRHFPYDWPKVLEAMALKDYNHPSVILYSLGNEIPEIATDHGAALGREMYRCLKKLDGTRYVFASVNGVFASGDDIDAIMSDVMAKAGPAGGNVNDFMTAMDANMDAIVTHPIVTDNLEKAAAGMDLIGYNYMTARYAADAVNYPNRVIVGSETYPPEIARNWAIIRAQSNVIGDFTWTGWDYLGEAGVGIPEYEPGSGGFGSHFPAQLAYVGDIDITGFRRPTSYFREIVFGLRKDPYITVLEPERLGQKPRTTPWILSDSYASWSHPEHEGETLAVEVYSPGDSVELILNGSSLGRKPAGPAAGFISRFRVPYVPGTLEAVAYSGEAVVGRAKLASADTGDRRIELTPEIMERLIFVEVSVQDKSGNVHTAGREELRCTVTGDAGLLGWGSGDPKPKHNYTGTVTETFHGRALAVLKKTAGHGSAVITAEGAEISGSRTLTW